MKPGKPISFIKHWRESKGMQQKELASLLNVTKATVVKWEQGMSAPNDDQIKSLCDIFGVSIYELLSPNDQAGKDFQCNCDKAFETLSSLHSLRLKRIRQNLIFSVTVGSLLLLILSAMLLDKVPVLLFLGLHVPIIGFIVFAASLLFMAITHRWEKPFIILCAAGSFVVLLVLGVLILAPVFGAPIPN